MSVSIPPVGLGLWKVPTASAADLIVKAIEVGYRHFDCACDYGNEREVGAGIRAAVSSGACRREQLWVTSKLWNTYHAREHVRPAVERSLSDLGLDYLDLYLIHFPIAQDFVPFETRYPPGWFFDPGAAKPGMKFARVSLAETWGAMEDLVAAGLVRHIGVCNYGTALLRDLLAYARIPPAVLQIELHPFLAQEKLVRFAASPGSRSRRSRRLGHSRTSLSEWPIPASRCSNTPPSATSPGFAAALPPRWFSAGRSREGRAWCPRQSDPNA